MSATTSERLRETEQRLDRAGSVVDAASTTVGAAANTAEAVGRWRSNPLAVIATVGIAAAIATMAWWRLGRSDG